MGYVRHGHELSEILHDRALAGAMVEDASDAETFSIFLVDIGAQEDWSPYFFERVEAVLQDSQRRLLLGFRYFVVWQDGHKIGYIHSPVIDVAAGMYDDIALRNRCAGAIGGYRAKEDRDVVPEGAVVAR